MNLLGSVLVDTDISVPYSFNMWDIFIVLNISKVCKGDFGLLNFDLRTIQEDVFLLSKLRFCFYFVLSIFGRQFLIVLLFIQTVQKYANFLS